MFEVAAGTLTSHRRSRQQPRDHVSGAMETPVRSPGLGGSSKVDVSGLGYELLFVLRNDTGPPHREVEAETSPKPSTAFLHAKSRFNSSGFLGLVLGSR